MKLYSTCLNRSSKYATNNDLQVFKMLARLPVEVRWNIYRFFFEDLTGFNTVVTHTKLCLVPNIYSNLLSVDHNLFYEILGFIRQKFDTTISFSDKLSISHDRCQPLNLLSTSRDRAIQIISHTRQVVILISPGTCFKCFAFLLRGFLSIRQVKSRKIVLRGHNPERFTLFSNSMNFLETFAIFARCHREAIAEKHHKWYEALFCRACWRPRYGTMHVHDCVICQDCGASKCIDCEVSFEERYGNICLSRGGLHQMYRIM